MRNKLILVFLTAAVIACSLPAFSQEKEKAPAEAEKKDEKDPSKLYVDLSGVMYLEWAYFSGFQYTGGSEWGKVYRWGINADNYYASGVLTDLLGAESTNYSRKNNNTFRMRRVYLTLKKQIGEMFSVKVTTDIEPTGQDFIYLKYGFVQFLKNFGTPVGDVELKAQLGKIATPVIGMTDYLNDLRWLGPNYLNNSKQVLNGKSFDDSADLGGAVSLTLFKMLKMEYSFTNGAGYKAAQ